MFCLGGGGGVKTKINKQTRNKPFYKTGLSFNFTLPPITPAILLWPGDGHIGVKSGAELDRYLGRDIGSSPSRVGGMYLRIYLCMMHGLKKSITTDRGVYYM